MVRRISVLSSAVALFLPGTAAAADFQHAVIIIADDLGSDKVSSYAVDVSNPTETRPSTPNIDMIAASGVRFSDAWAAPVCSPTRAMLYTGELSYRNGVGSVLGEGAEVTMRTSPDSLMDLAVASGVATGLFGKAHIGVGDQTPSEPTTTDLDYADYPIQVGFQWFQGTNAGSLDTYAEWVEVESIPDASMSSGYATSATLRTDSPTVVTTDDALAWLNMQSAAGQRRLAVVSYHLPHSAGVAGSAANWNSAVTACGGSPSARDQVRNFRLAAQCLDTELYQLLSGIPDLEDTLVIFLGDNGTPKAVAEGNFDDGRGKASTYESGIRVPFVIADGQAIQDAINNGGVPTAGSYRVESGIVSSDPASVVDVFATVADLLDLSSSTCTPGDTCAEDSASLRSVLEGGPATRTFVWSESFRDQASGVRTGYGALRMGDIKLRMQVVNATEPCVATEMYDLSVDRWEQNDIDGDAAYAAEQAALEAQLDLIRIDMEASTPGLQNWLAHGACGTCKSDEIWYDGFDTSCDADSDFDQDYDGVDFPEDCDDEDPLVYPGATDTWYDGVDADCAADSDFDQDRDGALYPADCADTDPAVFPGAPDDWYDGIDQNCDDMSDFDQDGDSFDLVDDCDDTRADVSPGHLETAYDGVDSDCLGDSDFDSDGDGFDSAVWGGTDCDDFDAATWPGAPEASDDGVDADCDGTPEVVDLDGDGVQSDGDCDDLDASVYPGAIEVAYDGIDQDCDGGDRTDVDRDGYDATAVGGTDCNDASATVHPGATDTWYDGVDSNCDGRNDYDRDGDGYTSSAYSGGTDCDDTRAGVKPGATEIWYDGVDQNCDGANDYDRDGDGYDRDTDCNDGARRIYPGAPGWGLDCVRL